MYPPRKLLSITFNVDFLYFHTRWKITELRLKGQKEVCHKNFILNIGKRFVIKCKMDDYSSPFQCIYWKNYSVKTQKVFTYHSRMDEKSKNVKCNIQFY